MRPCHFFLRREGVLEIGHLVSLLIATSASCAVNGTNRGTRKVISYLNGSLGSRYFLYVMNERTILHRERAHLKVPDWSLV